MVWKKKKRARGEEDDWVYAIPSASHQTVNKITRKARLAAHRAPCSSPRIVHVFALCCIVVGNNIKRFFRRILFFI